MVNVLKRQALDRVRGALNKWYAVHPDQLNRPVIETIWFDMSPNKEETIFASIDFEVDVDARRGRLVVPGLIESHGEPIRNPVTGDEHRVRIDLPKGFEYRLAEIGSGRSTTKGKIQFELKDTYGQFACIHLSHAGIVDEAVAA